MTTRKRSAGDLVKKVKAVPDTLLQFVLDVTDKLTLSKLGAAFIAGVLATVLTLFYENRTALFETAVTYVRGQKDTVGWELSDQTKTQMVGMVKSSQWMNMILVTEIDLQQNRRLPKYLYLDSPQEKNVQNKASILIPQPVFDLDPKNTQQMIGILNNEFVCNKFEDTIFARIYPELAKEMPYVCRLSIPPFYGRFVGLLTVGLRHQLSKDEMERLRVELARFSVEVYLRDVVKKPEPLVVPGHN